MVLNIVRFMISPLVVIAVITGISDSCKLELRQRMDIVFDIVITFVSSFCLGRFHGKLVTHICFACCCCCL